MSDLEINESGGGRGGGTIHASALLVGAMAVVVRGASGAGKSSLVLELLSVLAAEGRFARLIGDDRVVVEARAGRLLVKAVPTIAGMIERRGSGIVRMAFEPAGVVGLIVDLIAGEPRRLPELSDQCTTLCGIAVRRIEVAGFGQPRATALLAALDEEIAQSDVISDTRG